jgi:hypothetical protein
MMRGPCAGEAVIRQSQLYVVIGVFILLWAGMAELLYLLGRLDYITPTSIEQGLWRSFSAAVLGVFLAILLFDLWLWRLPWLPRWVVDRPLLNGTWKVELEVSWKDKDGQAHKKTLDGHMVVYQTYSTVSMRLLTDSSHSRLIASELTPDRDRSYTFGAVYQATPTPEARDTPERKIHYGGMLLVCHGRNPDLLQGHFWTDEFSRGTLRLTQRWSRRHFGSFAAAQAAFAEPARPTPTAPSGGK